MIRGLLLAVQALLWLLFLRLLLRTLGGFFARGGGAARPAGRQGPRALKVEDLVLDRVCHTHVPRTGALVARVGGREEHFCSAACRDKALAAVARAS